MSFQCNKSINHLQELWKVCKYAEMTQLTLGQPIAERRNLVRNFHFSSNK